MFHHFIAVIALAVGGYDAGSQQPAQRFDVSAPTADTFQPSGRRYWVQFRQPEWRDHAFALQQEMDEFIYDKQRNGWDVQVYAGELRVRYRLTQWGGSRIFDNLREAQAWAAYLERELGYEPRIVDY